MSHTPGPWRISSNEWSGDDEIIGANDKHVVCFGHGYGNYGGLESDDDARLIACGTGALSGTKRDGHCHLQFSRRGRMETIPILA